MIIFLQNNHFFSFSLLLRKKCVVLNSYRWVVAQSVFYHLYNQVSYMSLDQISPLTFSIGNTMKRISVIVSSIIIFHTPVQPVNALGAAIAILGTFLYSQVYSLLSLHNLTFQNSFEILGPKSGTQGTNLLSIWRQNSLE